MQMNTGRFDTSLIGAKRKPLHQANDYLLKGEQVKNYQQNRSIKAFEQKLKIEDQQEGVLIKEALRKSTNEQGVLDRRKAWNLIKDEPRIRAKAALDFHEKAKDDLDKQAANTAWESAIVTNEEIGKTDFDINKFTNMIVDSGVVDGAEYRKKFLEYAKEYKDMGKDDRLELEESHNKASQIYNDQKGKEGDPDKEAKDRRAWLLASSFALTMNDSDPRSVLEIDDVKTGKTSAQDFADKWKDTSKYATTRIVSEETLDAGIKGIEEAARSGGVDPVTAGLAIGQLSLPNVTQQVYNRVMGSITGQSASIGTARLKVPINIDAARQREEVMQTVKHAWRVKYPDFGGEEVKKMGGAYLGVRAASRLINRLEADNYADSFAMGDKWKQYISLGKHFGRFVDPNIDNAMRILKEVYGREQSGAAINEAEWYNFERQILDRKKLLTKAGRQVVIDNLKDFLIRFDTAGFGMTQNKEWYNEYYVDGANERIKKYLLESGDRYENTGSISGSKQKKINNLMNSVGP